MHMSVCLCAQVCAHICLYVCMCMHVCVCTRSCMRVHFLVLQILSCWCVTVIVPSFNATLLIQYKKKEYRSLWIKLTIPKEHETDKLMQMNKLKHSFYQDTSIFSQFSCMNYGVSFRAPKYNIQKCKVIKQYENVFCLLKLTATHQQDRRKQPPEQLYTHMEWIKPKC